MVAYRSRRSTLLGVVALFGAATLTGMTTARASTAGLHDYGPAPELTGIAQWLNSEPLTLAELKGRVVLIDFWTYSCINCLRSLPYVARWHEKFAGRGVVIVGVHTPEFGFEKSTRNVQAAIRRHGIIYPVAQDNQYATWKAFENQYWPAVYLIDRRGHIMLKHFGEGAYDDIERAVETLLD
ncbi:MAG: thioredoxin family protein, partial [Solimonas sp.]